MTEETRENADVSEAEAAEAPAIDESSDSEVLDTQEVDEGKAFAVLSYALSFIGLPFFLIPLITRNNGFALYHAKQCLLLWIAGAAVGVVATLLSVICIGVILGPILGVALLVLNVMGLINASGGKATPVPLIGSYAEQWFKGLRKV